MGKQPVMIALGGNNLSPKDISAAKMARIIKAQELWITSDIDYLYRNFGKDNATTIKQISIKALRNALHTKKYFSRRNYKTKN